MVPIREKIAALHSSSFAVKITDDGDQATWSSSESFDFFFPSDEPSEPSLVRRVLPGLTVRCTDSTCPGFHVTFESVVAVVRSTENVTGTSVFDELGNLRACLDGESHDLVEWAATTYEAYRTESRQVETIPDLNR